ncbi:MAG: response regulator [Chroococcidiopsidaceae cyanobacterium CP_BM_ER_R8_30]|nr:response regulator [Chroococcidiopsidaceae cyanobacterium CP_BM_ER_R8_30]
MWKSRQSWLKKLSVSYKSNLGKVQGTFQTLRPLSLLTHLSSCYDSVILKVLSNSVSWSLYVDQGKITYASHSVDPLDRLDRHLRRLGNRIPTLVSQAWAQLRLMFEKHAVNPPGSAQDPDYQAICWLVERQYLSPNQASTLVEGLVKEVIESFLLIKEGSYQSEKKLDTLPEFCYLDIQSVVEHCQKQLQAWQSLGPQIWSPYQRPYIFNKAKFSEQLFPDIQQKLNIFMKGCSFYHLAALLNQDELQLAQDLYPYIKDGSVLLYDPQPPFNQLPKTFEQFSNSSHTRIPDKPNLINTSITQANSDQKQSHLENNKTYTIVCVDDSPTMLQEIRRFLDDESFSVVLVNNPVKALMQIIRSKPDLILLDVKMASMDGYELCRLLRNHSSFRNTPIIMVTGNTGLIDRVKARLVGASGYLTKPFGHAELLKMVFKHLA